MPRRFRRYARSARAVKPVRYSNDTVAGQNSGALSANSTVVSIVVAASIAQGVRKVKTQPSVSLQVLPILKHPFSGLLFTALRVFLGLL
jgi:hypothetical protein